jgi:purine-binding chemotaxis protein CheW
MADTRTDHYILFTVAGTTYALPSDQVAHVEMVEHVTRVPNAAPFVDGVVFSRGQVVPAINMRARFGFERTPQDLRTRLLVVQSGTRHVGLLVDGCREFLTIPAAAVLPPAEGLSSDGGRSIVGVATLGDRLVVVLDLDALLNSEEPLLTA